MGNEPNMTEGLYRQRLLRSAAAAGMLLVALTALFSLLMPYQARSLLSHGFGRSRAGVLGSGVLAQSGRHELGDALVESVRVHGGLRLETIGTIGPLDTLESLRTGKAQFGLIPGGLDLDTTGILGLAPLHREYVHLLVPADGPILTFRHLAGKRVGTGPPGSASALLARAVFGYFDFAEKPTLITDHSSDLEKEFLAGHLDAAFTMYPLFSPAIEPLLSTGWYRLLPFPEAAGLARYRPGFLAEDLPGNLYGPDRALPPGDAPFPALAIEWGLVARSDASSAMATALLQAADDAGFIPGIAPDRPDTSRLGLVSGLPAHPAAVAYQTRIEGLTRDQFEAGAFFIMGLVLLGLLGRYAGQRLRRILAARQRQRIRPFFERLRELGLAIANTEDPRQVQTYMQELISLQRRAERAWLMSRFDTDDFKNLCVVYGIYNHAALIKLRPESGDYYRTLPVSEGEENAHSPVQSTFSGDPAPETAPGRGWPFDDNGGLEEEDPDQMTLF
jgi:uncharacterized protein